MHQQVTQDWTPLHAALQAIASRCDGARSEDGVGFRGQDVLFGHRVARHLKAADYTDAMAQEVYRLMRVYRGQLSDMHIDFDALPVPDVVAESTVHEARDEARAAERASKHKIDLAVDGADFTFKGDTYDHKDKIKAIGGHWDSGDKCWRVNVGRVGAVAWLVQTLPVNTSQGAEVLLEGSEAVEPEPVKGVKAAAILPGGLQAIVVWKDVTSEEFSLYLEESRLLPGRKYLAAQKANMVDVSEALLAFVRKHGFDGEQDVQDALLSIAEAQALEAQRAASAEAASRAHDTDREVAISDALYPFQRAGVAYIVDHAGGRGIVGDEMGLGKTRQGLSILETANAYPAVIVCPAHLKGNWLREIKSLLPDRTVSVAKGASPYETGTEITIINYDILSEWVAAESDDGDTDLLRPQGLLLDESHYVKNDKAQRTHAAKRLAARVPASGVVTCLTGTPVLNRPAEIISQLEIVNGLQHFGRKVDFLRSYCEAYDEDGRKTYTGARNLSELNRILRQNVYVRREKADVLTELPPKTRQTDYVDLSDKDMREYQKAKADIIAYLQELKGDAAADRASQAKKLVRLNMLRQLVGKAKINQSVDWVDEFVSSTGRKLVVFAVHREVQEQLAALIAERGYSVDRIKGGMTQEQVGAVVDNFQKGETQVLVASLKAGGTGHTLTAAQDVMFVEQGWTPGEHDQAEDRIHRIGQTGESTTAHYLLAPDTVDDILFNLIEGKRAIVTAVTSGEEVDDTHSMVDLVVDALLSGAATQK